MTTSCGTLDISSTANPMELIYTILFKVGGSTGAVVHELESSIHEIYIDVDSCSSPAITEPTDKSNYTQFGTAPNSNYFLVP